MTTSSSRSCADETTMEALERTVQEIQILNAIYNDEALDDDGDEDDDDSNATKFTIVSQDEFLKVQRLVKQWKANSTSSTRNATTSSSSSSNSSSIVDTRIVSGASASSSTIRSLQVQINVMLTSADGVNFEANVDITLPSKYPYESLIITSATITDLDLGRQSDEFSQVMAEKSKDLIGTEALVDMIQYVQDYAAEYVANYGHVRIDDSWNRPTYFTSYTFPNNDVMQQQHSHHQGEEENFDYKFSSPKTTGSKRILKQRTHEKSKPSSKFKSYKAAKPKRKVSQSKTFEQRLEDLQKFKEIHGHCIVPYTYEENQPLSNWCSNIRYSYGLMERGLSPTIKMTEERIKALRDIGFDFSALREQHMKRREGDDYDHDGSSEGDATAISTAASNSSRACHDPSVV